jgi:hypothetical protein
MEIKENEITIMVHICRTWVLSKRGQQLPDPYILHKSRFGLHP